ncbi:hypothetical protein CBR_g8245 [Chara braunii]|uniref:Uncharacterized protein n=1 Tax=Chara braunii TaxID=69332 RepID=A0A388KLL2_CHABU|nr:hypothetical protein CBR_g8245 [Chara braunii]|eukprot:GBG70944.1 hypothetical protein CBR_g8245 [Chara braunii]
MPVGQPQSMTAQQQSAAVQQPMAMPSMPTTMPPANFVPANAPAHVPQYQVQPATAPWAIQPWMANGQWPTPVPWPMPPVGHNYPANAQPSTQANQQTVEPSAPRAQSSNNGDNRSSKQPAANAFPRPGNRAYFTKEYMDILEEIKSDKVLDAAKKKVAGSRTEGIRISESAEGSCRSEVRSGNKSDDMKAWVTTTLGDSLKLITKKLEEVDSKAKMATAEKEELLLLRAEKAAMGKVKKKSSAEKRKRGGAAQPGCVTPAGNSNRGKSRSKNCRSRRVEISSDEEGEDGGDVRQNLSDKLEKSSDLSEVKKMLAAIVQGLADGKGKQPMAAPDPAAEGDHEDGENAEDVDVAVNASIQEEEEADEGGLATYMKMRQDFYMSLHYTRVQEIWKQRDIPYFRKEPAAWELARVDLQEYADQLNGGAALKGAEPSRKGAARNVDNSEVEDKGNDSISGN